MPDRDEPDVPASEQAGAPRTTATGYRSVSYFLPGTLHPRLKAAWWATRELVDGAPTLSALVERIFTAAVHELELEHNHGDPFPPAPAHAQGVNPDADTRRGASTPTGYRYFAYYLPGALHARLKAAWWGTRDLPGSAPTLSVLVEALLTQEAVRLELEHNHGDSFPPAPESARGVNTDAARRQGEWLRKEWDARRAASGDEKQD